MTSGPQEDWMEGSGLVHGSGDWDSFPFKPEKLLPFTNIVSASPVLVMAAISVSKCKEASYARLLYHASIDWTATHQATTLKGLTSSSSTIVSVLLKTSERNRILSSS